TSRSFWRYWVSAIGKFIPKSGAECRLYLAPGCADQVVQLTASHEYRVNFALNSISATHREIPLYGAHSDIGGGYLAGEGGTAEFGKNRTLS
ncbi:hypothetical protein ACV1DN_21300, partial [Aeromonas allosaccharophila]